MRARKFGENIVRILWGKEGGQMYFCNRCHVVCFRLAIPMMASDGDVRVESCCMFINLVIYDFWIMFG